MKPQIFSVASSRYYSDVSACSLFKQWEQPGSKTVLFPTCKGNRLSSYQWKGGKDPHEFQGGGMPLQEVFYQYQQSAKRREGSHLHQFNLLG